MERTDIALARCEFLRKAKQIEDWDKVVFLHETWLNANHTVSKIWNDGTGKSATKVPQGTTTNYLSCWDSQRADITMLKLELLRLVNLNKPPTPKYILDELAKSFGHTFLCLPPCHCQYNSIEMIWDQIKAYAARNNTTPLRIKSWAC
ncbi:unnamed protein product [Euphydryas editha]|uniref:Tc1-like transposase DDE domain-containing protein n=1 Tax=Euphydryas editha TaxID=104508 RepID=A0AAU9TTF3_EUPED|nr:unnamed protein product [Euphydryas editha]